MRVLRGDDTICGTLEFGEGQVGRQWVIPSLVVDWFAGGLTELWIYDDGPAEIN